MGAAASVPGRPQLAVSASIFRNETLLLVRRARDPLRGIYTLPGGRVEFGESLEQALQREVMEETGLSITVLGLAGWREVLPGPDVAGHFVILSFATRWQAGEVALNDELDDARWITPDQISGFKTTDGLHGIIRAAQALVMT